MHIFSLRALSLSLLLLIASSVGAQFYPAQRGIDYFAPRGGSEGDVLTKLAAGVGWAPPGASDEDLEAIAALACDDDEIIKRVGGVWDCAADAAGGTLNTEAEGVAVGSQDTIDFIDGAGHTWTITDTGTKITVQSDNSDTYWAKLADIHNGDAGACVSASANATTYTCTPVRASIAEYKKGMIFSWVPDVSCTGGVSTTLDVSGLGAKDVVRGADDPSASDCVEDIPVILGYDGTSLQILTGSSSGGAAAHALDMYSTVDGDRLHGTAISNQALGVTTVRCMKATYNKSMQFTKIAFYLTTGQAASTSGAGLYNASGTRLQQTGPIDTTGGAAPKSASFASTTYPAGIYYHCWASDVTTVGLGGITLGSTRNGFLASTAGILFTSSEAYVTATGMPATLGTLTKADSTSFPVVDVRLHN